MDVVASLEAPCPASRLFESVDDLGLYSGWLDLVHRAEPDESASNAWHVELRAGIGPLTRSKKLRMQRTVHDPVAGLARFERHELDGRQHSPWVLEAVVTALGSGSMLTMNLHYGGSLWTGGLVERALTDQIINGRQRLLAILATTP